MAVAEGRNASIEDISLRYRIALAGKNYQLAEDLAREAIAKDPDNRDAKIILAHALLLQKTPGARIRALEILENMQSGNDQYSLTAMRILAADEETSIALRLDAANRILSHLLCNFKDKLFARGIQAKLDPDNRDGVIDLVIAETTDATLSEVAEVGRWLNQIDKSDRVSEVIDMDTAKNPLVAYEGYEGLVKIARNEKKLNRLTELLETMVKKFPADGKATNDYNYYRLLAREEVDTATESAFKLYRTNPRLLSYRITLALAHLRNNSPDQAYLLLDLNGLEWEELSDIRKAVRAATLLEKQQEKEAQELIDSINMDALLPEERKLFGYRH